jgi:methylated-DNA-[protein]-cysteine S-methyltransferase
MREIERLDTPIGEMLLVVDQNGNLCATEWGEREGRLVRQYGDSAFHRGRPSDVSAKVRRYFEGDLSAIDAIPVEMSGTPFQRSVWSALRRIPCGTTVAYGALATSIGRPTAVRAVGAANGANPIGVVVPCHRVIGADGSLTGYGGGIERKAWLLAHEHVGGAGEIAARVIQVRRQANGVLALGDVDPVSRQLGFDLTSRPNTGTQRDER